MLEKHIAHSRLQDLEPEELVDSCLYYDNLFNDRSWLRRRVESISFIDNGSIRRQTTFDIDIGELTDRRSRWAVSNCIYLPLVESMKLQPLLDVDLVDDAGRSIHMGRRRENASIVAARLVGYIAGELYKINSRIDLEAHLWVKQTFIWLYTKLYENDDLEVEEIRDIPSISDTINKLLKSEDFHEALIKHKKCYTLSIADPFVSDTASNRLKLPEIRIVKFSYVSSVRDQRKEGNVGEDCDVDRNGGQSRRSFFSPFGPTYMIPIPNFGKGESASHVRVQSPENMTLDGSHLFCDDIDIQNEYGDCIDEESDGQTGHRKYAATCDDKGSSKVIAESVFDATRVEVLDRGLPSRIWQDQDGLWQLKVDLNPRRATFIIPSLALLVLSVGMLWAVTSIKTNSDMLAVVLPVVAGMLIVKQEHDVYSASLAGLRFMVGVSVMLCGLSGILNAGSSFLRGLFWGANILSFITILGLLWHICRIQAVRCPSLLAFVRHASRVCNLSDVGPGRSLARYVFKWSIWKKIFGRSDTGAKPLSLLLDGIKEFCSGVLFVNG